MFFLLSCCLTTPNAKTPRFVSARRPGRTIAPLFALLAKYETACPCGAPTVGAI